MSDAVYHKTTSRELLEFLERFYRDHVSDLDPGFRWLALQTIPLKAMVHDYANNGIGSFNEKYKKEISAMRLSEIEAERRKLQEQDERLEREAKGIAQYQCAS